MAQLAEVRLWDELVGALAYDEGSQFSTFEYASSWLKNGYKLRRCVYRWLRTNINLWV